MAERVKHTWTLNKKIRADFALRVRELAAPGIMVDFRNAMDIPLNVFAVDGTRVPPA
jgi:hypothetical protein